VAGVLNRPSAARDAARNNAEWCDSFCRTHGIVGRFDADAWSSSRRTPRFYPDAVTLVPRASAEQLLMRVDTSAGCSVKDSFADLDLAPAGFDVLFRAEWLWQVPSTDAARPAGWSRVETTAGLDRWETAWNESPDARSFFRRELPANDSIAVLARYDGDRVVGGVIATRSEAVIGLSNVFDVRGDLESAWRCGAEAARARSGPLPVVGYDSGEALDAARRAGFVAVGELAVWATSPP